LTQKKNVVKAYRSSQREKGGRNFAWGKEEENSLIYLEKKIASKQNQTPPRERDATEKREGDFFCPSLR